MSGKDVTLLFLMRFFVRYTGPALTRSSAYQVLDKRFKKMRKKYELVQAQNPKFRQPGMPHALTTRMSNILYHADVHEQWERVT